MRKVLISDKEHYKLPMIELFKRYTKTNVNVDYMMGLDYKDSHARGIRINSNYILINKLIKGHQTIILFNIPEDEKNIEKFIDEIDAEEVITTSAEVLDSFKLLN